MIYAEILAGGKGTRMGNTEMPKQFLMLGNKPIFIHTVEQFLLNRRIDKILICCPEQWMAYTKDTLKKYSVNMDTIFVIKGGNTRNETILNGCNFIEENFGLHDDDIILTHDAVRPFINQRIIDDNIDGTLKYGAIDTVVEAFDTIVHSIDGKLITDIPLRDEMYQGQTPQSFNIKLLMSLFHSLTKAEKEILTDACKALVIKGKDVHLVKGEVYNIKITTQHDLKVANGLIEGDK
ncbi:2-C-methyl-D-erythritol 4-phosphate cytidylyltransferase [Coprobacillus cateniformis]|jgi:2-C-methyl-D-erythritol 4-phosphate cytidylyltransferase|uniref:Ribitol-5-phosphate cytidylyltransferase n=1 Tax=Coprobacillus cateniformis TaxID=100884 RepID=E7G7K9_9FIRM|nr:2-C-methyl-D-erythritol 4-phosphate cytidylyltransferase [Coprobacillus cateniformis]EFW05993.1 2-C-methyl-D-erythritol 4-phosphate cytidylyltransferase [Coprobacillus cateniformis]RGY40827.1 2-C-methyl-D-erythritol 4-phosphate cytidylyltransferase [Coprobacillus cateniformis]